VSAAHALVRLVQGFLACSSDMSSYIAANSYWSECNKTVLKHARESFPNMNMYGFFRHDNELAAALG
jgi:hypothetical protein